MSSKQQPRFIFQWTTDELIIRLVGHKGRMRQSYGVKRIPATRDSGLIAVACSEVVDQAIARGARLQPMEVE